tara:strand:+ start:148 stop:378 length:231 start_codon:yes stop_codon:yes gene_type:complete
MTKEQKIDLYLLEEKKAIEIAKIKTMLYMIFEQPKKKKDKVDDKIDIDIITAIKNDIKFKILEIEKKIQKIKNKIK